MKLIVQIPCYDEEHTLPLTLSCIPKSLDGVDELEVLVVDDGSHDRTTQVADRMGVEHVVRHKRNLGLARAFASALEASLEAGADIIVNLDGDNQYDARDIGVLVEPIIAGRADIVVGDRGVSEIPHFSLMKRILHRIGSAVVRHVSGVPVQDAVSGFRAISRTAAQQIHIVSDFSYTIEMLIQAGAKGLAVESVAVRTNEVTRKSRLFRSIPHFIERSASTLLRMSFVFRPLCVFGTIGLVLVCIGALPVARFIHFWWLGDSAGHIQSLVLGGVSLTLGYTTFMIGLAADLISTNRRLLEKVLLGLAQHEPLRRGGSGSKPFQLTHARSQSNPEIEGLRHRDSTMTMKKRRRGS